MSGINAIKHHLKNMPSCAGVYRMLDKNGDVLYVGKAKNLAKRVTSYTNLKKLTPRIAAMVVSTVDMEIVTTRTEAEALLLESNLIKSLKPRYNILLRDDKSFPYIELNLKHNYPGIRKHRGKKNKDSVYFGPYASPGDVNKSMKILQKAFLLRSCSDNELKSRTRPCMEFQIKRCCAPCVGKISDGDYAVLVKQTQDFLSGKSSKVKQDLIKGMEHASLDFEYEKAAVYRDRIKALSSIQASQDINMSTIDEADVIAIASEQNRYCVQVFFVRNGQTLGTKSFFPTQTQDYSTEEVLEAFIGHFYQTNPSPKTIICSHDLYGKQLLEEALTEVNNHSVKIIIPQKGEKRKMVEITLVNAKDSLARKIAETSSEKDLLRKVAELFAINTPITRIDVFDNSHIFGKYAVGAMIVSGTEGFEKRNYRKFNVDSGEKLTGGDDYWMMKQVLTRRYSKLGADNKPNLVLIDGGEAHLNIATEIFNEIGITDIKYVCIAKGRDRNAGREDFYTTDKPPFKLEPNDPVLYYLQRLRDEAHRFAISTHRQKRDKNIHKSKLDSISGIGAHRKKLLLTHFGSLKLIEEATLGELCKVENINKKTAQKIYDYLHE